MPNDLKSLKEKKIKEVIISQSPQKNNSHIRFPQFDRFLFLSHGEGGEFHISHDASLHTILSSFRTHVMLSVQQGRDS